MARQFTDQDAGEARKGKQLPLMIGLLSPSSGGKTYTALRLATGIQQVVGGDIFVIDTEQDRALHYADDFKFRHVPFGEPYGSLDYLDALRYCKAKGAGVVVVDQVSYEYDGPGGLLEQHEAALDRMAGNDFKRRERVTFAAWIKPKANRKKLLNAIVAELDMPIIFCWRAKQTTKPVAGGQPLDMGYSSVGAEEWKFDMTCNIMFAPNAAGVPMLNSVKPGEAACIKIPKQFSWLYDHRGSIDEDCGKRMALWANGGGANPAISKARQTPQEYAEELLAAVSQAPDAATLDNIERKAQKALAKMSEDDSLKSLHDDAIKAFADKRQEFVGSSDPFAVQD